MSHLKRIFKLIQNEKGSVVVITALAMTAILGFTALVVDIGLLFFTRGALVRAADSAALAGVQELPENPEEAENMASHYASLNTSADNVEIEVNTDRNSVKVTLDKNVNFSFANILGISSQVATASSQAQSGGITSLRGAAPFMVPDTDFSTGSDYVLKYGANVSEWETIPGSYGAAQFSHSESADEFQDFIEKGYPEEIEVGDWLEPLHGVKSGPTSQGIDYRLEGCNHEVPCSFEDYKKDCTRIIFVPVYDPDSLSSGKVKVTGFAAFFLEDHVGSGNENEVEGRFMEMYGEGDLCFQQTSYGLHSIKLIH